MSADLKFNIICRLSCIVTDLARCSDPLAQTCCHDERQPFDLDV